MVTFILISNDGNILVYWYYPEGKEDCEPGIITVNLQENDISITKVAESDFERDIPPEELNELAIAINKMKQERGATDFVELVTEPEHSVWYGDHAVQEIQKKLNKGIIPQKGSQAWY